MRCLLLLRALSAVAYSPTVRHGGEARALLGVPSLLRPTAVVALRAGATAGDELEPWPENTHVTWSAADDAALWARQDEPADTLAAALGRKPGGVVRRLAKLRVSTSAASIRLFGTDAAADESLAEDDYLALDETALLGQCKVVPLSLSFGQCEVVVVVFLFRSALQRRHLSLSLGQWRSSSSLFEAFSFRQRAPRREGASLRRACLFGVQGGWGGAGSTSHARCARLSHGALRRSTRSARPVRVGSTRTRSRRRCASRTVRRASSRARRTTARSTATARSHSRGCAGSSRTRCGGPRRGSAATRSASTSRRASDATAELGSCHHDNGTPTPASQDRESGAGYLP